jgi:hypothetical protein
MGPLLKDQRLGVTGVVRRDDPLGLFPSSSAPTEPLRLDVTPKGWSCLFQLMVTSQINLFPLPTSIDKCTHPSHLMSALAAYRCVVLRYSPS